jgi:hypothetical protein
MDFADGIGGRFDVGNAGSGDDGRWQNAKVKRKNVKRIEEVGG